MHIKPIKNHIIFQFVDEVDNKGQFVKTTQWGFVIPGHYDNSAKMPRWATVVEVGPDCETVKVGQQILIHALKWTEGFKLDGVRFWKTDEKQVAALRHVNDSRVTALRDTIIFKRHENKAPASEAGLEVVGDIPRTPSGTIITVGPDVDAELQAGATVYFLDENFFSEFEHNEQKLWYIDEPSILVYQPLDE